MSVRVFFGVCIAILVMTSCSNTPKPPKKIKAKVPTQEAAVIVKDSQYYIEQARAAEQQNSGHEQRNQHLLNVMAMLQTEQQCSKTIKLYDVIFTELNQSTFVSRANLIMAECYLTLSKQYIALAEEYFSRVNLQHVDPTQYYATQSIILLENKDWLNASTSILKSNVSNVQKAQQIWLAINELSLAELQRAYTSHPALSPWLQLAIITRNYALSPEQLSQQTINWQNRNSSHPLQLNLPPELINALQSKTIKTQKTAILLPLTGRLASQGLAIKEGFIAAYYDNPSKIQGNQASSDDKKITEQFVEIRFFDSAQHSIEELNTLVSDFDLIVGPLLKENIQSLAEILPENKVMLALNRIASEFQNIQIQQNKEHYYFSLTPEDEALQLAQYIQNKQFTRPIIIAADNSITQRMAQAFIDEWNNNVNINKPDLVTFKDNKDMREGVTEMLGVAQSKDRIKQIEQLADVEVIGQERNRRDIDAVVLFATPEQTELLNPIIEASLSSFADVSLSVFASSKSYAGIQTSTSLRDLRNLTFSEMPWLLPKHTWQPLASKVSTLWPQKHDSLMRLFAMGYDAYNLIPKLRALKALPKATNQGLTGEMSLSATGEIHRRLSWANIDKDGVKNLGVD